MNRRNLFKMVFGAFLVPKVVKAAEPSRLMVYKPVVTEPVLAGYKGKDFLKTGIVYCPYVPMMRMSDSL